MEERHEASNATADATCTACATTDFRAGANAGATCLAKKAACAAGFKFAASSNSTADATCRPNLDIHDSMFTVLRMADSASALATTTATTPVLLTATATLPILKTTWRGAGSFCLEVSERRQR